MIRTTFKVTRIVCRILSLVDRWGEVKLVRLQTVAKPRTSRVIALCPDSYRAVEIRGVSKGISLFSFAVVDDGQGMARAI